MDCVDFEYCVNVFKCLLLFLIFVVFLCYSDVMDMLIEDFLFEEVLKQFEMIVVQFESGEMLLQQVIEFYEWGNVFCQCCVDWFDVVQVWIEVIWLDVEGKLVGVCLFVVG